MWSADNNVKTKNSNTFRFKSFAERVNEIDLRRLALYHIGHENEELPEDNETYFHQTLKKWIVLNLSTEFSQFSRKVLKVVTLPQLLHQKDYVVDVLLESLACATNLSLQPLLELLYVLARDLREEFYPYFQRVLDRLICLLNTQDAEQLEWTLVCLAYLFKALKPYLKRNIGVVFHSILPLLDERRYEENVTNFAVECFSFVARDVSDYGKFLNFVLATVESEQVESVQACGRLLFEIMRGVKGQLHSIAGDFLEFIFQSLVKVVDSGNASHEELMLAIVRHAMEHLLRFIAVSQMSLVWSKLCLVANNAHSAYKLRNVMQIFLLLVAFKDCKYLTDIEILVGCLLKLIDKLKECNQSEETLELTTGVISTILLSGSTQVTQLDTSRLLKKTLSIKQRKVYESFVISMALHTQFDIFIMPSLVQYVESNFDDQSIELMAQVILKRRPLCFNALNLERWDAIGIKVNSLETLNKIEEAVMNTDIHTKNNERQLLLLIAAPHIKGLNQNNLKNAIEKLRASVMLEIGSNNDTDKYLTILAFLIEIQCQLKITLDKAALKEVTMVLCQNLENKQILGCLNQLLWLHPKACKQDQNIRSKLAELLWHYDHDMRLLAAGSLRLLFMGQEAKTPYHIFYEVEQIVPTVHTYRDQLLLLHKLETQAELYKAFSEENYKVDCVRFLLGMLYHNFKLIWDPVLKLLEDYAKRMEISVFWSIYQEKLHATMEKIDLSPQRNTEVAVMPCTFWTSGTLNSALLCQLQSTLTLTQLFNYRILLWRHLPHYGRMFELKNRELIGIFLDFVHKEYEQYVEHKDNVWDLRLSSSMQLDLGDEDANDVEQSKLKPNHTQKGAGNDNVKFILQTLQCKLSVLAVQQNPRALYKEPMLWQLYGQLLKCSNDQLQKSALDCIVAYKHKYIQPYKDTLYNMVDEKKFKDALLDFKLDSLSPEHRELFVPLLLKLLYGKMLTKGSQKGLNTQQRKSIILRFLGQCNVSEIETFLQMAFSDFKEFTDDSFDILQIPEAVHNTFCLQAVWAPRKLQSVVNLLELIRKEFGGLMQRNVHNYMLKLLVFVGCVCNEVLQQDVAMLHPKMPVVFRNLKQNTLHSLHNFFEHIEDYEWSDELITCITTVFVYPSLEKLHLESIHTPTVLLKLLLLWGEKPKHFKYLRQLKEDTNKPIFHYIVLLLLNDKTKGAVRKPIMGLIERLLVASENKLEHSADGEALILPYIPELLQRLKMNFSTRKAKQPLDKQDLSILSMLTKHVHDADTCDSLLQLLLPILISKTQTQSSAEVVTQVINTLSNLMKRLAQPESYLRKIAPLFEHVQEVTARKLLCQLVADIAKLKHKLDETLEVTQTLKFTARIILMLNAWDKRWVEQPDYEKRLDAFKELCRRMESPAGLDLDLGILVIYNCFYFLRYDKDLGLRDNASEHLKLLLPHLTRKYAGDRPTVDYLVGDVFVSLIRRTIRDANDNVRNEGIRLLGEMARECPESHEILRDLHCLGDKQDAEVDFFENMVHLQSHRHGRALLKFNTMASGLRKAPCARTLTQFILPLASRYLLQEQHAAKHTLIDAAIETVGVVCQLLPWQHYHSVLRYYLMKMRSSHSFQKQCVRIVVRILDAFHFDLSLAQVGAEEAQKLKELIKQKTLEHDLLPTEAQTDDAGDLKNENEEGNNGVVDSMVEEELLENDLDSADASEDIDTVKAAEANSTSQHPLCLEDNIVLSSAVAKRVLTTITSVLIPTLSRSITENSTYDIKHKVNRKRLSSEREEEETLRVPISLALVKLMQKLPKELMDTSLPGVFLKVCTFLRSPLKSVRMLTRDILKKIMLCLGSSYLPMLVEHLQSLLTRGFQVHVLSVTIHGVLDAIRDLVQPADIEGCLHNLLEVTLNDIFGEVNAEKEVGKYTAHTPEAKPSAKSYLILHIVARNIRETCLLDLLLPFRDQLAKSKSRKLTLKIQDCFGKIINGLVENSHISRESLLVFVYGTMSESITDLLPGTQRRTLSEQEKKKMKISRPDCYIIPAVPRMGSNFVGKQARSSAQANAHILIEFGLEMLHIVLKRKKLQNVDYPPFLNPILPLLKDSLKSSHIRVTTFALKCFATLWVEEYQLESMQEPQYIKGVVDRMFEILKNFSTFGSTRQEDNLQLVKSSFKAVVALLRKCSYYDLNENQVEELILYIEQDLQEGENQAVTFSLLKALLTRKVESKSIHEVMNKIAEMSIVSPSDYVRSEARNMVSIYVIEYPLHKRIEHIVKFFSIQLCYSLSSGRLSAIEFLSMIIKKFPLSILGKHAEFLYLSLGSRLVNDEEPECRKAVAASIEFLISRLERADRQHLFDLTLLFLESSNKASVREMGAALFSRFLNAEKKHFSSRLKVLLPILVGRLTQSNSMKPGRFVRAPNADLDEDETPRMKKNKLNKSKKNFDTATLDRDVNQVLADEDATELELQRQQRAKDHELIQVQYALLKIFEHCAAEVLSNVELTHVIDELAYECQRLLGHEHIWVRCNAMKIIGHLLSHYDFAAVGLKLQSLECAVEGRVPVNLDFIYLNPEYDIKSLVLDLCAQVVPGETTANITDEIVKIFMYVATMLKNVPLAESKVQTEDEMDKTLTKINLRWLLTNMRFLINKEVRLASHSTIVRSAMFGLFEGLITLLDVEQLEILSPAILPVLVREMSEEDQNIDPNLRQLALRVGSRLRKRIGSDAYDKLRANAQMKLMVRRAERKRIIVQEKIHDPLRAAKRREAMQERKKLAKKRKADVMRGKAADVKQKLKRRKRKAEEEFV